jgi:hypothetical protein
LKVVQASAAFLAVNAAVLDYQVHDLLVGQARIQAKMR